MSLLRLKDGTELYYKDTDPEGTGRDTIVFLHGWTSSHQIFDLPVKALSARARCITYDHRGHCETAKANREEASEAGNGTGEGRDPAEPVTIGMLAEVLRELMTALDVERPVLFGWSMGAQVVMEYLKRYGDDDLRQVVLCDMAPRLLNDAEWSLGLKKGAYTRADMEAEQNMEFMDIYRSFSVACVPWLEKVPGHFLGRSLDRMLKDCDQAVLRNLSDSMLSGDYRDLVPKIRKPFTYFYADPGSLFSPALTVWYREHVAEEAAFRAVRFPNCTHMLIAEKPRKFTDEITRLLNTR